MAVAPRPEQRQDPEIAEVIAAALLSRAGARLLSPALTVVVQNSVPVARVGSAMTSQQLITTAPALAPAT